MALGSCLVLTTLFPLIAEEPVLQQLPNHQLVEDLATLPILTPALEGRKVEKFRLPNGLQVYLISDPGADQSAAGVAVDAGSWEDPKAYPGTAHFLEHMLFMGTEAYPNEFEYMQFVHDHGGSVNAFTAPDRTVYMFSINNETFEPALDRFSHFFIDPLLSTNCINRELLAVDQEHSKNIEHDGWRQYMILKETGNPEHPNSGFSTGNAQTLSGIPQSALRDWFQTHYSADRMHLVMISPLPLEELRTIAIADFSKVPRVEIPAASFPKEITSAEQRGHMIFIKPVKDIKQLSLTWEVTGPFAENIEKQAPTLVAYALNQQGDHSLIQVLKQEKLAENVHVTCDRFSKESLFFSMDIDLTDQGLKKVDAVIQRAFEALARLRVDGYPAYLFNEIQTIAKLNYQYQSRDDAFSTAMSIAASLPYEDLASYPLKTQIPTAFDPAFIRSFLDTLTAERCIYFVLADPLKTKVATDKKEKWMQADYAIKPISKSHMLAWNEIQPSSAIELPLQNPYLPTQLELVSSSASVNAQPTLLASSEASSIYYAQDDRYKVPEVSCLFSFKSPLLTHTASSQVLSDLYSRAFVEKLSTSLSLASNAGLSLRLYSNELSLNLSLSGYSDKAPLLLNEAFSALTQVTPSKEEFEIYKISLSSDYDNASKELPVRQAMQQLDGILFNTPTALEKFSTIQTLSYEQFIEFSKELFSTNYTEALFYGNITSSQADTLWKDLKTKLPSTPFLQPQHPKKTVLVLNDKNGPTKLVQNTDRQGSGVLLLLQEGPFSFEHKAIQQILGYALSDAFFDTLRTKQQTAYIAKAWNTEEERQLLQFFAVQSSTHSPTDLLARFELFLESFDKNLSIQLPEGRFESIRSNLITLLKMPPENMPGMASLLNELAFEYHDFGWVDKRIESMKALSYDTFCKVSHQLLSRSNPRRLAILMQGVIPKENDFHYKAITREETVNLGSFASVK